MPANMNPCILHQKLLKPNACYFRTRKCKCTSLVCLQIMDWMCLLLDAHFTVMVMLPEAKELLSNLHKFVRAQVSCIFWDNYLIFSWIQNMDVEKGGRQKTTNYIGNQIMCVLLYMLFPEHELQLPLSHLDFKSCFVWFKYLKLCRATDSSIV